MEVTISVVIFTITLVCGEITKMTNVPNKWIPLQNFIIAIISAIICIFFKVGDLNILSTFIYCIISTMSAGGISDLKKLSE